MSQYRTWIDRNGNLLMDGGTIICFHATTAYFKVGGSGKVVVPSTPETRDGIRAATTAGTSMQGGSGRNLLVSAGTGGTLVPAGFFPPAGPDSWTGPRGATVSYNAGDGSGEMHDGTDALATLAAGPATIAPYGTFNSTPYGESLNGGLPFSFDVTYEGASTTYPARAAFFEIYGGTATAEDGEFTRTGWQSWEHAVDSDWTIAIDGSGLGEMSDATDVVATRAADASKLYDPSGTWHATLYGMLTYNASEAWAGSMVLGAAVPIAGVLYVELVLDAVTDEVTGWTGPYFAASVPANVPLAFAYVPIAASDGLGGIDQIQEGPIYWKPNP